MVEKIKKECLLFDIAKEYLQCDFETGVVTWIKKFNKKANTKINSIAGSKKRNNYISIGLNRKAFFAHRFIYYCYHNELPEFIDHKDGVRDNNKISNLRKATKLENNQNCKLRKDNTSGIQGVYFNKKNKTWYAQIYINKKLTNLGWFSTIEEAEKIRKEAELIYYPFKHK